MLKSGNIKEWWAFRPCQRAPFVSYPFYVVAGGNNIWNYVALSLCSSQWSGGILFPLPPPTWTAAITVWSAFICCDAETTPEWPLSLCSYQNLEHPFLPFSVIFTDFFICVLVRSSTRYPYVLWSITALRGSIMFYLHYVMELFIMPVFLERVKNQWVHLPLYLGSLRCHATITVYWITDDWEEECKSRSIELGVFRSSDINDFVVHDEFNRYQSNVSAVKFRFWHCGGAAFEGVF